MAAAEEMNVAAAAPADVLSQLEDGFPNSATPFATAIVCVRALVHLTQHPGCGDHTTDLGPARMCERYTFPLDGSSTH